jgi:hypothetical protein
MTIPVSEPAPAMVTVDPSLAAGALEPFLAAKVPGPSPTAKAAETSSVVGTVTVEEVMELATSWYIDFPGMGVIDLEAPQLPEKVLDVVTERMFAKPSIMETIASVSQALQQYKCVGGFAHFTTPEAAETVLEEFATGTEPVADVSALPPTSAGQEASLPQPIEVAGTTAAAVATGTTEVVVGEAGSSPSRSVAVGADEVRVPDEPATAVQERVAPEDTTRTASRRSKRSRRRRARLCCRASSGEAQDLELACTSWAATPGSGDDTKNDKEVAARNTLERELNWARRAFNELILPATLISFLV